MYLPDEYFLLLMAVLERQGQLIEDVAAQRDEVMAACLEQQKTLRDLVSTMTSALRE